MHFRSYESPGLPGITQEIQKLKDEGNNIIVVTRHDYGQVEAHLRSWQMPIHLIVRKYFPEMEVRYRHPKTIPLPRTF